MISMTSVAVAAPARSAFAASRGRFEEIMAFVESGDAFSMSHGELEEALVTQGRELIRQLLQDHLDLRAQREPRLEVVDAEGKGRGGVEHDHKRSLTTLVGDVAVSRLAYRTRGQPNLHPADGTLNLPAEQYSHGQRRLAAIEASRGSYEGAAEAIQRATGARIGKRQVEHLAISAAVDFEAYYGACSREPSAVDDVLVLSAAGKGIVMRPRHCGIPPARPPPKARRS